MSLWSEYIKERNGRDSIEIEEGFATYVVRQNEIYLEDIYVRPDQRRNGIGSKLSRLVENRGKELGCKIMLASVYPEATGSTASLKAVLANGFELLRIDNELIWLMKEI